MKELTVGPSGPLVGSIAVPGDKSISHRALLLAAVAAGTSRLRGLLLGRDTRATLACLRGLGIDVEEKPEELVVHGRGLRGLQAPTTPLHCARSGTTMRLLAGLLAGQGFASTLTGDPQLLRRPMERVAGPLRRMGAEIETTAGCAPLNIRGRSLRGQEHILAVASAQVKSALLLAGLYAAGQTTIHQPGPARDHSERLMQVMGAEVQTTDLTVTLRPPQILAPLNLQIPGDLSSAAFLLVAALLVPGSVVTIERVGLNPTRTGLLEVLRRMGADLTWEVEGKAAGEPLGQITARASALQGVEIEDEVVVRMIDEFPLLAVAATQAEGRTVVRDAAELRVKESDRIAAVAGELAKLGARIKARPDGFVVAGPTPLRGAPVDSHGDHRLAMALAVAGLVATDGVTVHGAGCIADSFPGFDSSLAQLVGATGGEA